MTDFADFADFWALAKGWRKPFCNPRKTAEKAWDRAIKEGANGDTIILGAEGYSGHIDEENVEPRFVCMASVFINQERYEQYVELAQEMKEKAAANLLEQRRIYYGNGWRAAKRGEEPAEYIAESSLELREAYDLGRRNALAPKLRVVV